MKCIVSGLIVLLLFFKTDAQILPAEGDTVNYTMVGFTFPANEKAAYYQFEIARGNNNNQVYFNKNKTTKILAEENRIVATVPLLGENYTWKITYLNRKKKSLGSSPLYHFSVGKPAYADTGQFRLNVLQNDYKKNDLWVLCDGNKCMYDLNGNIIWYLPIIPGVLDKDGTIRDLKITKDHTITFLGNYGCYEIDYNGNILWQTPDSPKTSPDGSIYFHHEFTKLANGHYMAAAQEEIVVEIPSNLDTSTLSKDPGIFRQNNKYYKKIPSGTLLEYDSNRNIVWQISMSQYFVPADYFSTKLKSGSFVSETHMNSFYLDEKNNLLFVSFRNVNQVLKISYPDGKLIARFEGAKDTEHENNKLSFLGQHCISSDGHGNILLFNNGTEKKKGGISTIMAFKNDTLAGKELLIKLWEFPCIIDSRAPSFTPSGGSICRLTDNNILSSMGSAGRIFIVTPDKNILWNAIAEIYRDTDGWQRIAQYRVSVIEGQQHIERLIFYKKH